MNFPVYLTLPLILMLYLQSSQIHSSKTQDKTFHMECKNNKKKKKKKGNVYWFSTGISYCLAQTGPRKEDGVMIEF